MSDSEYTDSEYDSEYDSDYEDDGKEIQTKEKKRLNGHQKRKKAID